MNYLLKILNSIMFLKTLLNRRCTMATQSDLHNSSSPLNQDLSSLTNSLRMATMVAASTLAFTIGCHAKEQNRIEFTLDFTGDSLVVRDDRGAPVQFTPVARDNTPPGRTSSPAYLSITAVRNSQNECSVAILTRASGVPFPSQTNSVLD